MTPPADIRSAVKKPFFAPTETFPRGLQKVLFKNRMDTSSEVPPVGSGQHDPIASIREAALVVHQADRLCQFSFMSLDDILPDVVSILEKVYHPRERPISKKWEFFDAMKPIVLLRPNLHRPQNTDTDPGRAHSSPEISYVDDVQFFAAIMTLLACEGSSFSASQVKTLLEMGSSDAESLQTAMEVFKKSIFDFLQPGGGMSLTSSTLPPDGFVSALQRLKNLNKKMKIAVQNLEVVLERSRKASSPPSLCESVCDDTASNTTTSHKSSRK